MGELVADEIEQEEGLPRGMIYKVSGVKDRYRSKLQEHGMHRRGQDTNYWIKRWCGLRDSRGGYAVQTSCRFQTEAEFALARGAFLVRVVTDEATRRQRIAARYPQHTDAHDKAATESEVSRLPYHAQLYGTLPVGEIAPVLAWQYRFWRRAGQPLIIPQCP